MDNLEKIQFLFPFLDQREWTTHNQNHKILLVNNYSGEQFSYQRVILHSQHMKEIYNTRAVYPIPHTPKVIMGSIKNDDKCLNLLVQRSSKPFGKGLQQLSSVVLVMQVFKEILTILMVLTKKYGFFRITTNMIKMTNLDYFHIWINEFEELCHREFPLNSGNTSFDSKTMVLDVTHIFIENGFSQTFLPFFKLVNDEKVITFEKCTKIIEEMGKKAKTVPPAIKSYINLEDHSKSKGKSEVPEFLRKKANKYKQNNRRNVPSAKNTPPLRTSKIVENKSQIFLRKCFQNEVQYPERVSKQKMLKIPRVSEWSVSQYFEIEDIDKNGKAKSSKEREEFKPFFTKERTRTGEKEKRMREIEIEGQKNFFNEKGDFGSSQATTQIYNSGKSSVQAGFIEECKGKNKRLSSFGNKIGQLTFLKEEKSNIKNEKVIEEKTEESPSIHSYSKSETKKMRESELESDLDRLLDSDQLGLKKKSTSWQEEELRTLENEMNNILFE